MPYGLFDPLISEETIRPWQEAIDERRIDMSPTEARLRGFGAGALEGLRSFTTPYDLAMMALPMGVGAGAGLAARTAPRLMRASKALPRAVTMPAEFTRAAGPSAGIALPTEFGSYARAAGGELSAGAKAATDALKEAAFLKHIAKYVQ